MLFMSIGTWPHSNRDELVKRRSEGPIVPEGIKVLGEWIDVSGGRSFRLFEVDDAAALSVGTYAWNDLMDIETVAVLQTESILEAISA